jgi:hypothetical protein
LTRLFSDDESTPGWHAAAHFVRWGVVLVCLILVPGVAFIGQGIGRWLRTQTASRWRMPLAAAAPANEMPVSHIEEPSPPTISAADPAISPGESAAMYAGGRAKLPREAAPVEVAAVVPVSHASELPAGDAPLWQFAELEQVLRDQGALSYALESDRKSRYAYRFHCVMPPEQPGGQERTIEASGTTALEAIQRVVRQLSGPAALR